MNQHLHLVTLGVRDFETSKQFYTEALGWRPSASSNEEIMFFQAGGIVVSIYQREKLAEDALVDPQGNGFAGVTLAYNARSEAEVDGIISDFPDRLRTVAQGARRRPICAPSAWSR